MIPIKNNGSNGLPILNPTQVEALSRAKQYAVQESVKHVLQKQQAQAKQALENAVSSQDVTCIGGESMLLQKQQALILMCRVYVGSIYYDLREEVIRNAFSPFGPFKSINMSFDPITGKHKGFAFIEYECPEAAQLALEQMGGVNIGGRSIKVGRPANMPQSHPIIDLLLEESKQQKRLYVSSVHTDLTTADLKSVFSAFGKIISCSLVPDHLTGKHKGYGFLEYDNLQSADDAVGSMNLFDLGGQFLRVGKGITPRGLIIPPGSSFGIPESSILQLSQIPPLAPTSFEPASSKFQPPPATVNIQPPKVVNISSPGVVTPNAVGSLPPPGIAVPTMLGSNAEHVAKKQEATTELPNTLSAQEDVKLSGVGARHMIMQKLMRTGNTCVMVLKNMVGYEDIDDDLQQEVTDECGKFGQVDRVVIYEEKQSEDEDAEVEVKIFVKFSKATFCSEAIRALNGRWFGGRKIEALPFPQEKFNNQDLTD